MIVSKNMSESSAQLYHKTQSEKVKEMMHLHIWELSQDNLKFELRKFKLTNLFDDTNQNYFQILVKHLNSFNPEKGSFAYWNRRAMQKAIIKSIRFNRSYKNYKETVGDRIVTRYEARVQCAFDDTRYTDEKPLPHHDNTSRILKVCFDNGILTQPEVMVLFYKYCFKFTHIFIARMYHVSHTTIGNIESKALNSMRKYMSSHPEKFGR